MFRDVNNVITVAKLMYEHWNYWGVELCTPKGLFRYESYDKIPECFHHYIVFALKYSTITNILRLRCEESAYGTETL